MKQLLKTLKQLSFILLLLIVPLKAIGQLQVYELTCDQQRNPLGIGGTPSFSWMLNNAHQSDSQQAYQIMVATSPLKLNADAPDVWDSNKTKSESTSFIPYSGKALTSATTYYWKVRCWNQEDAVSDWSDTQSFSTGLLSADDWAGSKWIAMEEDDDTLIVPAIHAPLVKKILKGQKTGMYRMPLFRKVFAEKKEVKSAIAYICGLGHFELYLNGHKIGNNFLDPGWTKYDKSAQYVTFDVTQFVQKGPNVIGVMLGNGFYNIPRERYFKILGSFGAPKMRMRLQLRYADGSVGYVDSDASWKTIAGPIVYSSIYGGEDFDARKEPKGWNQEARDFDDSKWKKAKVVKQDIQLDPQIGTSIRVRDHIRCQRRFLNSKGQWIYDLGQNFSGIVRVKFKGQAGDSLLFRPAELLKADGTLNQRPVGKPYYFKYYCNGTDSIWSPRFSYYGFRYVQLEGAVPAGEPNPSNLPVVEELEGLHTTTRLEEVGRFHCSNPMFNKIYELIDWAIRSNLASVVTDCPHREKLGWLEQIHLMQYSMQYRYNMQPLYRKIMNDMAESQLDNGAIPTIAPEYVRFDSGFEDSPEWGSSFIISPWYIYQWYGDKSLLERYYPQMKRYLAYLGSRADAQGIVSYGLGDWYDIGPKAPGYSQLTSKGVTATAMYYYNALILSKVAGLLGHAADEATYRELSYQIRDAYNARYLHREGWYDSNSQTANAISAFMGLVPQESYNNVVAHLKEDIAKRGNALTAGDVGYRYVLQVLEASGNSQLVYDMNSKSDVPGYGWMLAHGATSLTESWQAYDNVSNNHLMLGHLMEWLFGGVGGIRQAPESVGFKHLLIDPHIVGDITSAQTSLKTPHGEVVCNWQLDGDAYELDLTIPTNCVADVVMPTGDYSSISNYGKPVSKMPDMEHRMDANNHVVLQLASGHYKLRTIHCTR